MNIFTRIREVISPSRNSDLKIATEMDFLPTLWLLGKTGAGKSSLIQIITGNSLIEIGNGFQPCTMTSQKFDFPEDAPLLRFLDTRGLAESDYDATEDIALCEKTSNALIIVMKAEEPEQGSVIEALKKIRKAKCIKHLLVVHTAVMQIENLHERQQCIIHNQTRIESVWGKKNIDSVNVDFELDDSSAVGIETLLSKLADILPIIAILGHKEQASTIEEENYLKLRREVLIFASLSGSSDMLPAIGLVSVPGLQIKMLHSLANQYGITWDKKTFAEFLGALGTGFSVQYLTKLGTRQLIKLIPVYGQIVGTATSVAISFTTTYALGRACCYYFYHKSKGKPFDPEELKSIYDSVFEKMCKRKDH